MSKDRINNKTFKLVGLGILTAIIIVLQIVTTFFPTKPVSITLALIPIIIGAAFYGAGAVYKALSKKSTTLGAVAAGVVSPIVNTGIFVLGLFFFFKPVLEAWAGGTDIVYYALITMTGVNFLVELGVNIILSPVIVRIIQAVSKSKS